MGGMVRKKQGRVGRHFALMQKIELTISGYKFFKKLYKLYILLKLYIKLLKLYKEPLKNNF